jgi:hypothetical protein
MPWTRTHWFRLGRVGVVQTETEDSTKIILIRKVTKYEEKAYFLQIAD